MASQNQNIVDVGSKAVVVEKTYGTRKHASLAACFKSPLYGDDAIITNETLKAVYNQLIEGENVTGILKSGELKFNPGPGLGLDTFNPNFVGTSEVDSVPDIPNLTHTSDGKKFGDGQGAPESPYIPPLTSPVDGVNADTQPGFLAAGGAKTDLPKMGHEFGSGYGATANPAITSPLAASHKLGTFISGESFIDSRIKG